MDSLQFLRQIRNGGMVAEMGEEIEKVVESVQKTLKPGTLTMKLTVKPIGNGRVRVAAALATQEPREEREDTLFFVTEDFGLSRQMPGQASLAITEEIER